MYHKNCRSYVRGLKLINCGKCSKQVGTGFDCFSICNECSDKYNICKICGEEVKCSHRDENNKTTLDYDSPIEMRTSDMHCTQCWKHGSKEELLEEL